MTLIKESEALFTNSYRKLFEDYLVFHETIRQRYLPLSETNFGIDPYSFKDFLKLLKKKTNYTSICCFLFLDAAIDSTIHFLDLHKLRDNVLPRKAFVLNCSSLFYNEDHLSHTYPQILLGLKKDWTDEDLIIFSKHIFLYITNLIESLKQEDKSNNIETILDTLANDKDINNRYKGPSYLGDITRPITVYQNVFKIIWTEYKKGVAA